MHVSDRRICVCVCVCVRVVCIILLALEAKNGKSSLVWRTDLSATSSKSSIHRDFFLLFSFFIRQVFEGSLARSLARPLNITRTRSLRAPLKLLIRHAGILSDSRVSAREYDEINNLTTNSGTSTPIERSSNDDPNDRRRRVELLKDLVERRILFEKILWFKDFSFFPILKLN